MDKTASSYWDTPIAYLKGVGPQRAQMLNTELGIFTFRDLLEFLPFRYEDRTSFATVKELTSQEEKYVQLKGMIRGMEEAGSGAKRRLIVYFYDGTGIIELVWFKKIDWIKKQLKPGIEYVAYGRVQLFQNTYTMPHPEIEPYQGDDKLGLRPVYHSTEKLKRKGLDSRGISRLIANLLPAALPHVQDPLPLSIRQRYDLLPKAEALAQLHFPKSSYLLEQAQKRMKFEEIFFFQLYLVQAKIYRKQHFAGQILDKVELSRRFIEEVLPFRLTNAQRRVLREIYADMKSGRQMNRLVQGDVGSGKTVVAFIAALIAIDSGAQACLMAPTEILADQHYKSFCEFAEKLPVKVAKLTGSTPQAERRALLAGLQSGEIDLLVGTHALIEDSVQFKNLGLSIIDEQHRFGVEQRSKLWQKNEGIHPHVLVMTATPIPRTLAMTFYSDLDVSIIDELPPGRKPVRTIHRYDKHRLSVFGFVREELKKGRQAYFVYPLIEESESLDLKDLMDGYESIRRAFPEYHVSIVHGRMRPQDKDYEMQRFARGETQIMVATTVIEVGVNVPNASVMIIENAERFGLAQLHQLRGRVGRGAEQSYCILMTGNQLSTEARRRIRTMVESNDGFEIANVDLEIRGPGDITGTRQSGLNLMFTNLAKDYPIIEKAKKAVEELLAADPTLQAPEHALLKKHVQMQAAEKLNWARIS